MSDEGDVVFWGSGKGNRRVWWRARRTSRSLQTWPSWRGSLGFSPRRPWIVQGTQSLGEFERKEGRVTVSPSVQSKRKTRKGPPGTADPRVSRTHTLISSTFMDILPENDGLLADTPTLLSYDQDIAYEDQVSATPTPPSLADRIGRSKVYLLSESNVTRGSKVRACQCP